MKYIDFYPSILQENRKVAKELVVQGKLTPEEFEQLQEEQMQVSQQEHLDIQTPPEPLPLSAVPEPSLRVKHILKIRTYLVVSNSAVTFFTVSLTTGGGGGGGGGTATGFLTTGAGGATFSNMV